MEDAPDVQNMEDAPAVQSLTQTTRESILQDSPIRVTRRYKMVINLNCASITSLTFILSNFHPVVILLCYWEKAQAHPLIWHHALPRRHLLGSSSLGS